MSRRKSKTKSTSTAAGRPPKSPVEVSRPQAPGGTRDGQGKVSALPDVPLTKEEHVPAGGDSEWHVLNVSEVARPRGELLRRFLSAAVLICILPPLCALMLLPFFYRKTNAGVIVTSEELDHSWVYSLPEYEEAVASGKNLSWYNWVRLADPRQCLLPDWRAGFSRFNQFQPQYAAEGFPKYQSSKTARQPLYHELFALISPQSPKTLANEQVNLLWQRQNSLMQNAIPLKLKPSVHRPVWQFSDGLPIAEDEAPVLSAEALNYWRAPETRKRLGERMRDAADGTIGRTLLELQIPPGVKLPRVTATSSDSLEAPLVVPRVVLRRSCGDGRLDQAAIEALRVLLGRRSTAVQTAKPGSHFLSVDWSCW